MGIENDSHTGHLDRLFEHRNKEYGAYALRKAYNRQLIKGSVGMMLVVVLCVGGYYWWGGKERLAGRKDVADLSLKGSCLELFVPTEPETLLPKLPVINCCNNVPLIVPDAIVKEPPDLENIAIASTICEGITDNLILPDPPSPEEFGTDAASSTDSVEPECFFTGCNETSPQYPGGREAMLRFIDSALGFPGLVPEMDSAMEAVEKVIVLAQFRIEADGQLSDIQFPGPAIEPYQTKVRRVLEAMPKWIPGTQNEKPVPMVLKLPVRFLLLEE